MNEVTNTISTLQSFVFQKNAELKHEIQAAHVCFVYRVDRDRCKSTKSSEPSDLTALIINSAGERSGSCLPKNITKKKR